MKKIKGVVFICIFIALIIPLYTAVRAVDEGAEKENTNIVNIENK
jgi:hypothetical protein